MIHILAYDLRAAEGVAFRMGLRRSQWHFISTDHDLRGTSRPCVLISNDAYRRPDYSRIIEVVQSRQSWIWSEAQ